MELRSLPVMWAGVVKRALLLTLLLFLALALGLWLALLVGPVEVAISVNGLVVLFVVVFAFFLLVELRRGVR